jgi:dTDP-4-dehydrorhamnose 3,5-epimerase-like enzyme
VVNPMKYLSKPEGWVMETADFTELSYFLGYKFEPRSMYAIWSPEGVGRGGHIESRTKFISVLSGLIYNCLIDMRPGPEMGKTYECYLGEGDDALARSILVPEGVIDYYVPVKGPALTHSVGDKPYNRFDNLRTLDMFDPDLRLTKIPREAKHHIPDNVELNILSYKEFVAKLK